MKNKLLKAGVILAVLAVAVLAMAGAGAAGSTTFTPSENYYTTAESLVNALNSSSTSGPVAVLTTMFSQNDTVRLLQNVTVDTREIRVKGNNLVLDLYGKVLNTTSSCRVIRNDGSLTIVDTNPYDYDYHFFTGFSDGFWTWNGDTGLTENVVKGGVITGGNWESGGAIYTIGTLELKGGTIVGNKSSNYGGGVYVADNATFTMTGGMITNCSAPYGCGVYVAGKATFTMNDGGTIARCSATTYGGGVYVANGGTFTMNSGIITYCHCQSGGGVYVATGGKFTMYGGTISNCYCSATYGGGVYVADNATFTMYGGTINYCFCTAIYGGGVYVDTGGKFTLDGGTITYCFADYGGAVYVANGGTFTMNSGTITSCSSDYSGGGVYVANGGTFTMNGGEISNCTPDCVYNSDGSSVSSSSAQSSAGVLTASAAADANSGGKTTINGGTIDGKVINNGDMEIGGDAKIEEIELPAGKKITFLDTITDGAKIGIKLEDPERASKFLEGKPELVKMIIKNKIIECKNPGKHFDVDEDGNPVIKTDSVNSSSSVTSFFGEKDGNDFTFKRAVVITKATLPGATYATVTNTSGSGWYTCNLSTDGTSGVLYFQVPLDVIDIKGWTVNDVSVLGCTTTYLSNDDQYAYYSAIITKDGALTIDFEKDAAQKAVETKPVTETKTLEIPVTTTPVTTEKPVTTETTPVAKSPFPVLGILAGLGIAGLVALRRK